MTGNNSRAWYASVETLTQSAKLIKCPTAANLPDGTELMLATDAVYAMLLGYAIECALKGLWVKAGNKLVQGGRFVNVPGAGTHQIGRLARVVSHRTGVAVSAAECEVLDRLSAFVLFAGRYPISLTPEKMAHVDVPGRGAQSPRFFSGEDFQAAELVLNRFSRALNPDLEALTPQLDTNF